VDTTAPVLRSLVKKRQRVLRTRGVIAYVRCNEACAVAAGARLRIGGRAYKLRRASTLSPSGKRTRLKVTAGKKARRLIRRGLARHRRISLSVSLQARDAVGNQAPLVRRKVLLRRSG